MGLEKVLMFKGAGVVFLKNSRGVDFFKPRFALSINFNGL